MTHRVRLTAKEKATPALSRMRIALLLVLLTLPSAASLFASGRFDHAEYMEATAAGQKKASPAVKGALSFNTEKRSVEFLNQKGAPAFSISYDSIKSILYEQTAKPRYAEAVLISPLFLFSNSKKHYLTIQYVDETGSARFVIVHLDKNNAREAVAAAESETGQKVEHVEQK